MSKKYFESLKAAWRGNTEAQLKTGNAHLYGYGTKKNYKKAFYWFRIAAKKGDPTAQYQVGLMYQKGLGVDKDLGKAKQWYSKIAGLENLMADKELTEINLNNR